MEKMKNQAVWFPAKKYGVGWGLPISWQGWVVSLSYILLTIIGSIYLAHSDKDIIWLIPYILVLTILFLFICWKKGEKLE